MKNEYSDVWIALFLLTQLMASCAMANSTIEGVVMDDSTRKPIPGAFVIVEWSHRGADLVGSRSSCPHMEIAKADERGRYAISVPRKFGSNRNLHSYKAGYEWFLKGREPDEHVMSMRPFKGTAGERRESFQTYGSLRLCAKDGKSLEKLRPLYQELDEELRQLFPVEEEWNPVSGKRRRYVETLEQDLKSFGNRLGEKGAR
jgi:hypothetical protein